jgi:hypothetical protein
MADTPGLPPIEFNSELVSEFEFKADLADARRGFEASQNEQIPRALLEEAILRDGTFSMVVLGAVLERDNLEEWYQNAPESDRSFIADRLRAQEDRVRRLKRK